MRLDAPAGGRSGYPAALARAFLQKLFPDRAKEASRLHGALSIVQWRWPVWSSGRRVCLRGYDEFLRARILRLACWAICLAPDHYARVAQLLLPAFLTCLIFRDRKCRRPGQLPGRSNCKGPPGLPCAVTPRSWDMAASCHVQCWSLIPGPPPGSRGISVIFRGE